MKQLAILLFLLIAIFSVRAFSQPAQDVGGSLRGITSDGSGGVLPGVSVVAMSTDGRVLATTVTDETGTFVFDVLPAGPVNIKFQLDGFAAVSTRLAVQPASEVRVNQRLEIASLAESVVVRGRPPVEPPRPRFTLRKVPAHDPASVCGPAKATPATPPLGTVRSGSIEGRQLLYAKGDEVLVEGGTLNGLEVGMNLVVRRHFSVADAIGEPRSKTPTLGEHTSGVLQIVSADERSSTAIVVYACDEMRQGDFLAAFAPEPVRIPDAPGAPAYNDAARILFGDLGQMLGVARRQMVIDRGRDHGLHPGQRVTIFRHTRPDTAFASIVGDAVVTAVRDDSATIRIERATDGIRFGDWAAPQRPVGSALLLGRR